MPEPTTGEALDARLDQLLEDTVTEAAEAKRVYEAAKTRHEAARKREAAIRQAQESIRGTVQRPPDAANGESVDEGHARDVLQMRRQG